MVNSASRTDSDVAGGAGREEMNEDIFRAGCVSNGQHCPSCRAWERTRATGVFV